MNVLMGQYVHSNLVSLENVLNLCSVTNFKKIKNYQMIRDTLYRIREALKKAIGRGFGSCSAYRA